MSEVTSEEAKVNWIQRPKKLVLDSRSLPGQDRTGQGAQQFAQWVLVAAVAARMAWVLQRQFRRKRQKPKGSQTSHKV